MFFGNSHYNTKSYGGWVAHAGQSFIKETMWSQLQKQMNSR